jgi:hypothetical protein
MGFSRNLGTVNSEDLKRVAVAATTTEEVDLVNKKFITNPQLGPEEQSILEDAVAMAHAGLVGLGGSGDVHLGGSHNVLPNGDTQRSISVTITTTTPKS